MVLHGTAESTGSFAVYDTDGRKMCKVGIVQIFIKLGKRFVHGFAKKIDFSGNVHGFGHLHTSGMTSL